MVVLGGGFVSYEQGTPVGVTVVSYERGADVRRKGARSCRRKSEDRVRDGPASGEDFTCLGPWAISGTTLQGRNQERLEYITQNGIMSMASRGLSQAMST